MAKHMNDSVYSNELENIDVILHVHPIYLNFN
jgi:hypothetical protein